MSITIPDKKPKKIEQSSGTEQSYTAKKGIKSQLCLSIDNKYGEIKNVEKEVELIINGSNVPIIDKSDYSSGQVASNIVIATKNPLPDGPISNSSIKLKYKSLFNDQTIEKEIKLEVGGVDPIFAPDYKPNGKATDDKAPKKAVQKILTNLGYYNGEIDGDLEKSESKIAIYGFQNDYMSNDQINGEFGNANDATCYCLIAKTGISMGPVQKIKYDK